MSPQDATWIQPFCMTGRWILVNIDWDLIWVGSWRTIETGLGADKTTLLTSHPTLKLESWRRNGKEQAKDFLAHNCSADPSIPPATYLASLLARERAKWGVLARILTVFTSLPGVLGPIQGFFHLIVCKRLFVWSTGSIIFLHMSLFKCSPWFGGHSVVKILAQWFECDDTPTG